MRYVSTAELKQRLAALIEHARREPVTIRDEQGDVAVILSADAYRKLSRREAIEALNRFCDMVGERTAARGLTDEKLAELLAEDG